MTIPFFKPYITGKELDYIADIISNKRDMSGDGMYTKRVHALLEKRYGAKKALLTTSGTTALELGVRLLNLKQGDEVILPSFTFSSTANAVLTVSGAKIVFAEILPDTLNIDPDDIKRKITKRTRAIIVVHYGGVACDMDAIIGLAKKHNLFVIEDAAQGLESTYKGKYLGTIGDLGCISFHDTKNITCGEGGALFINRNTNIFTKRAEIIREKGTNRSQFFRGEIDKYTWVDTGSSYLPSDILAAYLFAQLEYAQTITKKRIAVFNEYYKALFQYEKMGIIHLPKRTPYSSGNGHIFYLLFNTEKERDVVKKFLQSQGIHATFHYIPLHSAPMGRSRGYKAHDLPITQRVGSTLLRLPLYPDMTPQEREYVLRNLKAVLTLIGKKSSAEKTTWQKTIRHMTK